MNPSRKPLSVRQSDEIQDSLDAITAISNLLCIAGDTCGPALADDRTVSAAALLIRRESRNIARLLGLREGDAPPPGKV